MIAFPKGTSFVPPLKPIRRGRIRKKDRPVVDPREVKDEPPAAAPASLAGPRAWTEEAYLRTWREEIASAPKPKDENAGNVPRSKGTNRKGNQS